MQQRKNHLSYSNCFEILLFDNQASFGRPFCPLFRKKHLSSRNLCSFVFDTPRDNEALLICAPARKKRVSQVFHVSFRFFNGTDARCVSRHVSPREMRSIHFRFSRKNPLHDRALSVTRFFRFFSFYVLLMILIGEHK